MANARRHLTTVMVTVATHQMLVRSAEYDCADACTYAVGDRHQTICLTAKPTERLGEYLHVPVVCTSNTQHHAAASE